MPELRKDYILDRYVIIATERAKRPHEMAHEEEVVQKKCFFCPGSEDQTPPEIYSIKKDGKWQVRVFANKFPAVAEAGNPCIATDNEFYTYADAIGRHEVIVETPNHDLQLADLSVEEISQVIQVYRLRQVEISKIDGIKYVSVFKNSGENAGCSVAHTHSQIIAYNVVPTLVREKERLTRAMGGCPYCNIVAKETDSDRSIYQDDLVSAFTPYASRFPYEAWIFPKRHLSRFDELTIDEINSFAKAVKIILTKLKSINAPYNFFFHYGTNDMHFHFEILPRFPKVKWAGFEMSTGTIINPVVPEDAATFYREQ